ncbi:uncharacterized protein I303_104173 [Kwoniella dejecticola CBS 10117]|uniref:High-temperature-induced dauer-formation protein n=1 Tax=Kwoniella dejecticola CBS 10117 TaxID=1296121 RepID=A0A1A6A626_9TREE|nr:uncharacterized protein I303_04849 [Kwoniella dejecticola CBS 10117]OBR85513.1 hypothetical protein I303_04849 [Kwoniella dejecticola CBS 10117]
MFKNLPTFKSLPQAIGLPFLSTQEDAQLKFKSSPGGIKRLYSDEIISTTDATYWAQYYSLFSSSADVYSLISVQDVRQALTNQPQNLANLILTLSHHLFTLLPSPDFPHSSSSQQDLSKEALNCLRVLGRILVVIYESEADLKEKFDHGIISPQELEESFAKKWLWSRSIVEPVTKPTATSAEEPSKQEDENDQFKIEDSDSEHEDDDEGEDEGVRAFKATVGNPAPAPKTAKEEGVSNDPLSTTESQDQQNKEKEDEDATDYMPCLIERLFSCTIDLLFCAGFTVPDNVRGANVTEKINYVIWEKGVGSTVNVGSTAELDRNKTEVLRFLLIMLSTTIYTPPHALSTNPNLPLQILTHSLERRLVLSLLCSFINTSLTPLKTSFGISGQIPYNHLISKAAEERRTLVRASLMVLLVALDHRVEGERDIMGEGKEENAFRYFISKLHRKEDFSFLLEGIIGILQEHNAVTNGYLPGSKRPIPYILETYILLWRLVDLNKRFRQYLLDSGKALDVVCYILVTCLNLKDDPAHHGLLRLLSYLLQTLSADKAFAVSLNQTIRMAIPSKWAVAGTAADFMIVSIYSIATTPGLNPLFPALTISISNIAPYLTNIGVQASTRLLQLFKSFSAPNFLLADEGHPRLVYYLLETFNSILYHQLNENPHLVYAILRSHQDFQTLATFTLMSGLRDIQRRKALRAAAAERNAAKLGLQRTPSELDMLAEKAALLGRDPETEDNEISSPASQRRALSPTIQENAEANATSAQPLTTPGVEVVSDPLAQSPPANLASPPPPIQGSNGGLSEKQRGKLRATDTESITGSIDGTMDVSIPDDELMRVAQAGVGPNGYIPTQEWVSSWQKGLPLDPVLVAISELLPKIQENQQLTGAPSSKVFNILKGVSLSEVLPPAPPIVPRRFQWSSASCVWLTSLLWGDIYVAGLTTDGAWRDTTVRLFGVKQAPVKGRGAQVGRFLKTIGVV